MHPNEFATGTPDVIEQKWVALRETLDYAKANWCALGIEELADVLSK